MTSLLDKAMDATIAPGFSKLGYWVRQRSWEPITESMDGRTVVITGATSGLGKAAASGLADLNASVILVGRNKEKAERVRAEIVAETGNDGVRIEIADLSLMAEIRDLAARLLAGGDPIHVLINNAGTLFRERSVTSEGIESTLATNLLGHFLLTNLLIPRLVESAPSRIINVTSGGMYSQRISIGNLQNDQGEYRAPLPTPAPSAGRSFSPRCGPSSSRTRASQSTRCTPGGPTRPALRIRFPASTRSPNHFCGALKRGRTPLCGWRPATSRQAAPACSGTIGHRAQPTRPSEQWNVPRSGRSCGRRCLSWPASS